MKRFVLALCFLCVCSFAYADAVVTVNSITVDNAGEVAISYQIDVDGDVSQYTKRFSYYNFAGLTQQQLVQRLSRKLKDHAKHKIVLAFRSLKNLELIANLQQYVGQSFTQTDATILIDTDDDGDPNEVWTIHSDGSYTTAPCTPELCG